MSEVREELKEIKLRRTEGRKSELVLGIDGWTKWAKLLKEGNIPDAVVNFAYNLGPGMSVGEIKDYFRIHMEVDGDYVVKMKNDKGEMEELAVSFNSVQALMLGLVGSRGSCLNYPWRNMGEELGKAIEKCLQEEWLFFDKTTGLLLTKEIMEKEIQKR